jgi:hypothetical protein
MASLMSVQGVSPTAEVTAAYQENDMGYGEFGGDGSVQWTTDVDNVRGKPDSKAKGTKGHVQSGIDEDGKPEAGHQFKVSIKPPASMNAQQFRAELQKPNGIVVDPIANRVVFYVPIEGHTPGQIKVSWPAESVEVDDYIKNKA